MLTHQNIEPKIPDRVVILGAGGFIASAVKRKFELEAIPLLLLPRRTLDLTQSGADDQLAKHLLSEDTLLFTAAQAPVKNEAMLIANLKMVEAVCEALRKNPVRHVVYISSDAVYADSDNPLTERSRAQPSSLHGVMHLAREVMLSNAYQGSLCLLRPTLVYGNDDPHNGYGPNRFIRLAQEGKDIILFGKGEELRDHVWVEDVAEIISQVILNCSEGTLNIATGEVISFYEIATLASQLFQRTVGIISTPRTGHMPHRGYRPFDINALNKAFPEYRLSSINNYFSSKSVIN